MFKFVKGEDFVIVDVLSRVIVEVYDECLRIMNICMVFDIIYLCFEEICKVREEDFELQCLIIYIIQGWFGKKNLIEDLVRYFFDLCEILSVYIGIVVKGEVIVILKLLCCDIKY